MKRLFVLFLFWPLVLFAPEKKLPMTQEEYFNHWFTYQLNENPLPNFTLELFYDYLIYLKVPNRDIVFKQAQHETGNFKSHKFTQCNNLFGMMIPRIRKTTAVSSIDHFAYYEHWTESVKDYVLFLDYRKPKQVCYYRYLDSVGYATDKEYTMKLKKIKMKPLLSSEEVVLENRTYKKPRFEVKKPILTASEKIVIKLFAEEKGYQCLIKENDFLIIKDGIPGFVQKHKNHKTNKELLFIAFKDGSYDNISRIISLQKAFIQFNIFPVDDPDAFNFQGICNWVATCKTGSL